MTWLLISNAELNLDVVTLPRGLMDLYRSRLVTFPAVSAQLIIKEDIICLQMVGCVARDKKPGRRSADAQLRRLSSVGARHAPARRSGERTGREVVLRVLTAPVTALIIRPDSRHLINKCATGHHNRVQLKPAPMMT